MDLQRQGWIVEKRNRRWVVALIGCCCVLFSILIIESTLAREKAAIRAAALQNTSNLTVSVANNFRSLFDEMDKEMLTVAEEITRQRASGHVDREAINAFIARHDARLPNCIGFRVFGADGRLLYGVHNIADRQADISQRPDFQFLRDAPAGARIVNPPLKGIATTAWLVGAPRRLTNPDGSFGGAVYLGISSDELARLFSDIDLGPGGVLVFFHSSYQVAVRLPAAKSDNVFAMTTPALRNFVSSGAKSINYEPVSPFDQVRRFSSIRKVDGLPYYVLVGEAQSQYLHEWNRRHVKYYAAGAVVVGLIMVAVLGAFQRIDEHNRMAAEAQAAARKFQGVLSSITDGLFTLDREGRCTYHNEQARRLFGLSARETITNQYIWDIAPPAVAALLYGYFPCAEGISKAPLKFEVYCPLPLDKWLDCRCYFDETGGAVYFHEISAHKQAEERLLLSEKMASVGRLAGGIAHEFNNLLMIVRSYAEALQEQLPEHEGLRKKAQVIVNAAERGAGLTRQLLAFGRKQILTPTLLDLNAVIGEAASMLMPLVRGNIEFRLKPGEALWAVEADASQIVEVLMNLCTNARDAMPRGGRLTIATGNISVGEGEPGKNSVPPGEYAWFSVADSGTGMSQEVQEHIFEPFFTTKQIGQGTGLGLATVYGTVKQSGGFIQVDSGPGKGSCFTIFLPRVPGDVGAQGEALVAIAPAEAETLLVVEDEAALREAICEYLQGLGYRVLVAGGAHQALQVASQWRERIDLLVTDLVMPGEGGRELAEMLECLRPGLKTVFMYGSGGHAVTRGSGCEANTIFLQKPFSLSTLARRVREHLSEGTVQ